MEIAQEIDFWLPREFKRNHEKRAICKNLADTDGLGWCVIAGKIANLMEIFWYDPANFYLFFSTCEMGGPDEVAILFHAWFCTFCI